LEAFINAAQRGNLAALENLFAQEVASYADGGGMVRAARIPVIGRERVAKFVASFSSHFWTGMTLEWTEVNGQTAVLMIRDGNVVTLATVDATADGIEQILWIMRPSKLAAVARTGQKLGENLRADGAVS
jgi:SnoaL-like domain